MPTSQDRTPSSPEERLGFLIYRAGLAVARGYERALAPIKVTPTEAGVLSTLAYSGRNHTRGLARVLGLGRQTIVNITKRLEEGKLIVRSSDTEDGRLVVFEITNTGRRKLVEIEKIAGGFDEELQQVVGSNETTMIKVLQRVVASPMLAHDD